MANSRVVLRKVHRFFVPVIALPLLVTVLTGMGFQVAMLSGQGSEFQWLLSVHRGQFGPVNLELIYPFLNGISMIVLIVTGVLMWFGWPRRKPQVKS
ncbi:MAG: PepSY domain-containing protein [Prochlorothrix sp.]